MGLEEGRKSNRREPVDRRLGSSEDDRDATDATGSDACAGSRLCQGQRGGGLAEGDREGAYALVRRTLVQLGYHRLGKPGKGLVKRYLGKVSGCSRAQLTRLIRQHRETGRIEDRRGGGGAPVRAFERRYTRMDIRLLAQVGAQLDQVRTQAQERSE